MKQVYVRMTDKFMSGWGQARGKTNVMVVACDDWNQAEAIQRAAMKRPEMKYVQICIRKPASKPHILYSHKSFSDLSGPWLEFYRKHVAA